MTREFLPYLRFFPAETLADERFSNWSLEERGAWFTLLLHAWVNGSIPDDMPSLARMLRVRVDTMRRLWRSIGDRFEPASGGRLVCKRLESEREEAVKRSQSAAKAAGKRWSLEPLPGGKPAKPLDAPDASALPGLMPASHRISSHHREANTASQAVTPSCAVPSVPSQEEAGTTGVAPLALVSAPAPKAKPSDPLRRVLSDALVAVGREERGGSFAFDATKDAQALTRLLGWSRDVDDHARRFRAALKAPAVEYGHHVDTIHGFATSRVWNHFASAKQPTTLRPLGAPGA